MVKETNSIDLINFPKKIINLKLCIRLFYLWEK